MRIENRRASPPPLFDEVFEVGGFTDLARDLWLISGLGRGIGRQRRPWMTWALVLCKYPPPLLSCDIAHRLDFQPHLCNGSDGLRVRVRAREEQPIDGQRDCNQADVQLDECVLPTLPSSAASLRRCELALTVSSEFLLVGPSSSVLVNIGARFVPCMKVLFLLCRSHKNSPMSPGPDFPSSTERDRCTSRLPRPVLQRDEEHRVRPVYTPSFFSFARLTSNNRAHSAFQTDGRSVPHQRVVQPLGRLHPSPDLAVLRAHLPTRRCRPPAPERPRPPHRRRPDRTRARLALIQYHLLCRGRVWV